MEYLGWLRRVHKWFLYFFAWHSWHCGPVYTWHEHPMNIPVTAVNLALIGHPHKHYPPIQNSNGKSIIYHLVMTNSLPWDRWPIEIDSLPIKNGGSFHSYDKSPSGSSMIFAGNHHLLRDFPTGEAPQRDPDPVNPRGRCDERAAARRAWSCHRSSWPQRKVVPHS